MSKLPSLPAHLQRIQELKLQNLVEKYGFTGDQYSWKESRKRQNLSLQENISLLTKAKSEAEKRIAWTQIYDYVGVNESLQFAQEWFRTLADVYFEFWVELSGRSEDFDEWLKILILNVSGRVREYWAESIQWFERACAKLIEDKLGELRNEYMMKARHLEILHLNNPELSLKLLLQTNRNVILSKIHKGQEENKNQIENKVKYIQTLIDSQLEDSRQLGKRLKPPQELSQNLTPKRKSRRQSDLDRHREIAAIVNQFDPNWMTENAQWRTNELFGQICRALDESLVVVPSSWRIPQKTKHGVMISTWVEAFEMGDKKLTKETIAYSLGKVKSLEISAKNQKT